MESENRRDKRKERMRRMILDAAMRLFVKQGFDNVTLRNVAEKIGYSPAAIYRYFRSKREILAALRAEGFAIFVEGQKKVLALSDPLERLRAAGLDYLRFAKKRPGYFHLMFNMELDGKDFRGDWLEKPVEAFDLLRKLAGDCIAAGHFQGQDAEAVVIGLWASAHGLATLLLSGRIGVLSPDRDVWELLERVIAFNLRSDRMDRKTSPETAPEAGRDNRNPL